MLETYNGGTRIYPVVGDPIAQVKSPYGVTQEFEARGADAICVPMQIAPADFASFVETMRKTKNCDGMIITVPHKFSAHDACDTVTDRARFLRSVNTIRRTPDGQLHGDMFDGLGFVEACRANGCAFTDKRALVVGSGGAGTAIAHAIVSAGVEELGIAELDAERRDSLIVRLTGQGFNVHPADADPTGYDLIFNATPLGMRPGDPSPVDLGKLTRAMFVGDVVTKPEVPPFIAAARALGCSTSAGIDMFVKVRDLMIDFLLATEEDRIGRGGRTQ
jgi:shikimate dehydrogenase